MELNLTKIANPNQSLEWSLYSTLNGLSHMIQKTSIEFKIKIDIDKSWLNHYYKSFQEFYKSFKKEDMSRFKEIFQSHGFKIKEIFPEKEESIVIVFE